MPTHVQAGLFPGHPHLFFFGLHFIIIHREWQISHIFFVPVYGMLWFTVAMNVLVGSNFVSTRNEHRKLMQEFHKRLCLQAKISQSEVVS